MQQNSLVKSTLIACISEVSSLLEQHEDSIKYNQDRTAALENLKSIDLGTLEAFFEGMNKKLDTLKSNAISKYNMKYDTIVKKIQDNTKCLQTASEVCSSTIEKLLDLDANIAKNSSLGQFILPETIEGMSAKAKVPVVPTPVDEELEDIFSKEETYSEIGSFSVILGNLESRLAYFLNENLSGFVKETHIVKKPEVLFEKPTDLVPIKPRSKVLAENFESVLEGTLEYLDISHKPLLHQVRYASNEVFTFDSETKQFATYELFTDSEYKVPFTIFNNSGTCIWKNQIIFFFGGEDPEQKNKTSNRGFCANIALAKGKNKLIVKEIPSMLFRRQEFSLATLGDSIYLISGYDMNLNRERRVIPKCERLHINSRRFYEIRDINYPRQWSSCINHNNTHLYVFAGQNSKYMNNFVDKVEKYMVHLNDWSVLKYTILDNFEYEPAIKMGIYKIAENEIVIMGGERDEVSQNDYYVFDLKKNMFVKRKTKFLKGEDHFANRNEAAIEENRVFLFSGCYVNRVYDIDVSERINYNFTLGTQQVDN